MVHNIEGTVLVIFKFLLISEVSFTVCWVRKKQGVSVVQAPILVYLIKTEIFSHHSRFIVTDQKTKLTGAKIIYYFIIYLIRFSA